MDLDVAIKRIIDTGKVEFGEKTASRAVSSGSAKLLILSNNAPKHAVLAENARTAGIPLVEFAGNSIQLSRVCGKPFTVSAVTVLDAGSVSLSELSKTTRRAGTTQGMEMQ